MPLIASATQFDFAFTNGAGLWDNNGGGDWHIAVTGAQPPNEWTMDGAVDSDATLVAQNGARRLWAGLKGTRLYVATDDAGEGQDVFLFVADTAAGSLRAAPWSKAGQVAAWSAFLADENDNDYEGWFNQLGSSLTGGGSPQATTAANGGVVEGTLDLAGHLGTVPERLAFAAAPFGNANGGTLVAAGQAPASANGNATIEASEFVVVDACAITVPLPGAGAGTCCPADIDGNGAVDGADLTAILNAWGSANAAADIDDSGTVDAADLAAALGAWGPC